MSIHDAVDAAVKALVVAAVPTAVVVGLDGEEAVIDRPPPTGRIAIGDGDPGDPDVTLSPLTYHYDRAIAIDVTGDAATVRAILAAIGAAIESDRQLGGLVDFLDATAPLVAADGTTGGATVTTASATIVASYATPHPL